MNLQEPREFKLLKSDMSVIKTSVTLCVCPVTVALKFSGVAL